MSAGQGELQLTGAVERRRPGLPLAARFYLAAVIAATLGASLPLLVRIDADTHRWTAFFVLSGGAALAQLFVVRTTRDQSYHTSTVFLIAGALLLPPELVVLIGVVQHLPEWLKHRYAWYIQTFNIANFTLDGLAAWGAARLIVEHTPTWANHGLFSAVAGLCACVAFVALNHTLMAAMLWLARGHHPRETGLFSAAMLSTEFVLAALGIGVAAFWDINPWLIPFTLAPLLLIHRSLHVPRLEEQARVDAKTGLFNARHFSMVLIDELARAERFERPAALIIADLDLLRDVNNTYGHLVGDQVLEGVAEVFRAELRHYDVPARFGGEEFAILLPETGLDEALAIADRIRRAVADKRFDVEASNEPVRVTVSMGVSCFPDHGTDPNQLLHHADLAVYRAKLQGRNRVLGAGAELGLIGADRAPRLVTLPPEDADPDRRFRSLPVLLERPGRPVRGPRLLTLSRRLGVLVGAVAAAGIAAGAIGIVFGDSTDVLGMVGAVALVGVAQVLALDLKEGSVSVGVVGALTGGALFDFRSALPVAVVCVAIESIAHKPPIHRALFNLGTLSVAALASAGMFWLGNLAGLGRPLLLATGVAAGFAYHVANLGLNSVAVAIEGRRHPLRVWRDRFAWLLPRYAAFGLVAAVLAVAYEVVGIPALALAVLPLLLLRRSRPDHIVHSAEQVREAAETIHSQNVSLEQANRLLRERSAAAMASLSATVDARDSYTAGHSRRVQRLALEIGRELDLSQAELDLLGHAALFHDIGKLAIPDSILMKPARLDTEEWRLMRQHADEGAELIDRLGFLADAVPAIRHHHERYDGSGYPDGLTGEEIPLGARIIHVCDALDSMLTSRIYRPAMTEDEAFAELRDGAGTQFCPRCVRALERAVGFESETGASELVTV